MASMPPGGTTAVQLQFGMVAVVPPSATGAPVAPGVAPCLRSGHDCESGDAPVSPVALGVAPCLRSGHDCESGDAPVLMTGGFGNAHLLALPIELLVQVLASLSGLRLRAILWQQPKTSPEAHPSGHCDLYGLTIGHALAAAGACCKAFAVPVHEAATIIAGGHGWRLPVVGSAPKHLSKLEQDTKRVQFYLRDKSSAHLSTARGQFFSLWTMEASPGFIGALSIDPQVRRQHTLEFGDFLMNLGMTVRSDAQITWVCDQLDRLMAQAGTPLNSSWLAARVFPLVKEHMVGPPPGWHAYSFQKRKKASLVRLLGCITPSVLRSHQEIFEWLETSLKGMKARVIVGPDSEWKYTNESVWEAGRRAWDERCEAQGLKLQDCDKDTKLEAMVGCGQASGCFARLPLSGLDPPLDFWSTRDGCDFPCNISRPSSWAEWQLLSVGSRFMWSTCGRHMWSTCGRHVV